MALLSPQAGRLPVAAVVLAAGRGQRFGSAKQLVPLAGRPLLAWAVGAALAAPLAGVLVVTGQEGDAVAQALPPHPRLEVIHNPRHGEGMGTSLALAAQWAARQEGLLALAVLLADQPLIGPASLEAVARACLASPAGAAAVVCDGQRGHPVALARPHWEELARLEGDQGARALLARLGASLALVPAPPQSQLDVDTPADLAAVTAALEQAHPPAGPLTQALGLAIPQVVALAGSGGKTSLLHALAAELARAGQPVLATTTTHLYPPQAGQAAATWLLGQDLPHPDELPQRLAAANPLCLAQGLTPQGKLKGLTPEQIKALAWLPGLWLLVEADGSAGKPLKAWAAHEPAWPPWCGQAILLAGASGLGRPLGDAWVHRPQLFAALSGLAPGQEITPVALARALSSPGPRQGLPPHVPLSLLLNQAETVSPATLRQLRAQLHGHARFHRLLIASLRAGRIEVWPE